MSSPREGASSLAPSSSSSSSPTRARSDATVGMVRDRQVYPSTNYAALGIGIGMFGDALKNGLETPGMTEGIVAASAVSGIGLPLAGAIIIASMMIKLFESKKELEALFVKCEFILERNLGMLYYNIHILAQYEKIYDEIKESEIKGERVAGTTVFGSDINPFALFTHSELLTRLKEHLDTFVSYCKDIILPNDSRDSVIETIFTDNEGAENDKSFRKQFTERCAKRFWNTRFGRALSSANNQRRLMFRAGKHQREILKDITLINAQFILLNYEVDRLVGFVKDHDTKKVAFKYRNEIYDATFYTLLKGSHNKDVQDKLTDDFIMKVPKKELARRVESLRVLPPSSYPEAIEGGARGGRRRVWKTRRYGGRGLHRKQPSPTKRNTKRNVGAGKKVL